MLDKEKSASDRAYLYLNYCDYLSCSCKKRWRFRDAMCGVIPLLGIVTRVENKNYKQQSDCFKQLALQIISTQMSDEMNITRLIILAERQRIYRLDIQLPYPLIATQLITIQREYSKPLSLSQIDDCLSVRLIVDAAHK